ncbi:hypothetical protein EAF00_007197 [Botryotinia globosa]|nr:hypothetical protein EAF00_007197 [Botryotinia globosa]
MMSEQISPPPPDWPKRPILDYTNDDDRVSICFGSGPPEAPNNKVYHVSWLRLAYHSPRFRKLFDEDVSSRGFGFCEISEFWRDKPDIFGHILQYVNTGSIINPTHVAHNTLLPACNECSLSSIEERYKAGLTHSYKDPDFYDDSPFLIKGFTDAVQIAVTAQSKIFGYRNEVERKAKGVDTKTSSWKCVYNEIDFGSSEYGLDRCFSFEQDLLKLGEKEAAD